MVLGLQFLLESGPAFRGERALQGLPEGATTGLDGLREGLHWGSPRLGPPGGIGLVGGVSGKGAHGIEAEGRLGRSPFGSGMAAPLFQFGKQRQILLHHHPIAEQLLSAAAGLLSHGTRHGGALQQGQQSRQRR